MIQNIIFDMGNVLLLYDTKIYVEQYLEDPEDRQLLLDELFNSVEWVRMDRGSITEEEVIDAVNQRLPPHLQGASKHFIENWHKESPRFDEIEALIAQLKAEGYGIYLLSNASKRFYTYKNQIPAIRYFDGLFISADWHLCKPDPACFRFFCKHFGITPESCFFVDDFNMNIEAAQHVGMQGFLFRRNVSALRQALQQAGVNIIVT